LIVSATVTVSAAPAFTGAPVTTVTGEDEVAPAPADTEPSAPAEPEASAPADSPSEAPAADPVDPADEPDPAADDGAADDGAADEPAADEEDPADSADEDPVDEEPTDEEPADEEPSDEEPADEEPADEDLTEESADPATAEASPSTAVGAPAISINGSAGSPIGTVAVTASGDGLAPSSSFELVVYSEPQVLFSGTADATGGFNASANLPANLPPGAHTVVFRGLDTLGQAVESGVGFTVAPDGTFGEVTGPVAQSSLPTPSSATTEPAQQAKAAAMAPAFAPVNALDAPAAVVTTSIAALTLATALGAAAAGGFSSGGSSSNGGGGNGADGGVDAKVEGRRKKGQSTGDVDDRDEFDEEIETTHNRGWRTRFQPTGTSPGDLSRTHRFPGTALTDELSYVSILAVAPKSPLLARTIDDAGAWRAIFGSLSLLLPIAGVGVGIASAINTGGVAQPPALGLMAALLVIGVLDSLAGLLAFLAFGIGVIVSGGIVDLASVRTMMGLALLIMGPGLMASSFRDTRRSAARTPAQWWERATDLVVVPLMGGWITLSIVAALPGLGGYDFPIGNDARLLAILVLVVLILNVLAEEAAARWYPERLATVVPDERPDPGSTQIVISTFMRAGLFLLVSAAFIGNVWQLWVAALFFTIPNLLRLVEDRLPNSPRLWQALPLGLPQLGLMLILGGVIAAAVASAFGQTAEFAQMSFVILAVPGLLLDVLGAFGREPNEGDTRWYCRPSWTVTYRVGGVAVLLATSWLALNV
jgi:hypothetical protein